MNEESKYMGGYFCCERGKTQGLPVCYECARESVGYCKPTAYADAPAVAVNAEAVPLIAERDALAAKLAEAVEALQEQIAQTRSALILLKCDEEFIDAQVARAAAVVKEHE